MKSRYETMSIKESLPYPLGENGHLSLSQKLFSKIPHI